MKIALIKCSGSLNVGNEFINAGGIHLVKQVYTEADYLEYEFFDSAIKLNYKYPSPGLLDWTKRQIERECDIMFVFCGSIISKFMADTLQELAAIRIKKVLLGAGAYQYDDFDKNLCLKLSNDFDCIFTRDDETLSYFKRAENVFSGIDLAFFVKDALNNPKENGDYALINLGLIQHRKDEIMAHYKELAPKYKNVYVCENTTTPHRDTEHFLHMGYWDNLYKTISQASFVLTNFIHTAVCCLSNLVPFIYFGYDAEGMTGRNLLFHKVNFKLKKGEVHTVQDLEKVSAHIELEKKNMISNLKMALDRKPSRAKVSVIVPVYNVLDYIKESLDSIVNQTLTDIEIICVDDCGQDKSMEIVEEYARKDKRIVILRHPVNKGLGAARNSGAAAATGKYLACVDSDDYIDLTMLEKAYQKLEETGFDSVWVKVNTYLEDKKTFTTENYYKGLFEHQGGELEITARNIAHFPVNAWNKVYRLDFIKGHGLKWSAGLLYEDLEFYYHFYTLSSKTFLIDELLYVYRWRQGSIMNQTDSGKCRCEDIYDVTFNIYNTLKNNGLLGKYEDAFLSLAERNIKLFLYNRHYRNRVISAGKQLLEKIKFPAEYKNARRHQFLHQLRKYDPARKENPWLNLLLRLVPFERPRAKLYAWLKGSDI